MLSSITLGLVQPQGQSAIARLFANNEPGFDYDFSDRSTLFQDTAGTTPVTGVEQTVALILDKSMGLVLGPELVANGSFSSAASWSTPIAGASITGGALTFDGVTSIASGAQVTINTPTAAIVAGRTYLVSYTIIGGTTGNVSMAVGNTVTSVQSAAGTYTQYVVATDSSPPDIRTRSSSGIRTGSIDNISVRELPGLHQLQSTAASRAVLRSRYNLLTYSEDLSNAAWNKNGAPTITANAGVAPDGTTTADQIAGTASGSGVYEVVPSTAGATYEFLAHLKYVSGGTDFFVGCDFSPSTATLTVNSQTGAITAQGAAITSAATTSLGNGWFAVRGRFVSTGATNTMVIYAAATGNTALAWGADFRSLNDSVLTYPYQRINAATDYATGPQWPTYLEYDGVDDSYASAANLDLSGTDKLTVFAAVTKLSDAATGVIAELSSSPGTNSGVFSLQSPGGTPASERAVWLSRGTSSSFAIATGTFAAPVTGVLTAIGDIVGDSAVLRINGTQTATSSTDQGTGNFGSYPLFLGRTNNASLPFRGRMYRVIGRGAATPVPLITAVEQQLNGQVGRVY